MAHIVCRSAIERLISLGFYYRELNRFATESRDLSWIQSSVDVSPPHADKTQKGKVRKGSVYRRAIANGITEILSVYRSAVLQVEQNLLSDPLPILATVTHGLNKVCPLPPFIYIFCLYISSSNWEIYVVFMIFNALMYLLISYWYLPYSFLC